MSGFRDAAIVPPGGESQVQDAPLPAEWKGHEYSGSPVLLGHYWFSGAPEVISKRFACLDYSVAKGGLWLPIDGTEKGSYPRRGWCVCRRCG